MFLLKKQNSKRYFFTLLSLLLATSAFFTQIKTASADDPTKYAPKNVQPSTADISGSSKCRFKLSGLAPDLPFGTNKQNVSIKVTITGDGATKTNIIDYNTGGAAVAILPAVGGGLYNDSAFSYYSPEVTCDKTYSYRVETIDKNRNPVEVIGTMVGTHRTDPTAAPAPVVNPTTQVVAAQVAAATPQSTNVKECIDKCEKGSWIDVSKQIGHVVCVMQCKVLGWLAGALDEAFKTILLPNLI